MNHSLRVLQQRLTFDMFIDTCCQGGVRIYRPALIEAGSLGSGGGGEQRPRYCPSLKASECKVYGEFHANRQYIAGSRFGPRINLSTADSIARYLNMVAFSERICHIGTRMLPPEIVAMICQLLTLSDMSNLRCCCEPLNGYFVNWCHQVCTLRLGSRYSNLHLSDISALANFPKLQVLDLSGTGVSDVTVLGSCAILKELHLSGTGVRPA